jgi:hypothetical protein
MVKASRNKPYHAKDSSYLSIFNIPPKYNVNYNFEGYKFKKKIIFKALVTKELFNPF